MNFTNRKGIFLIITDVDCNRNLKTISLDNVQKRFNLKKLGNIFEFIRFSFNIDHNCFLLNDSYMGFTEGLYINAATKFF